LFFDALAPLLIELVAPAGPVVALQADNENSFFFRNAPFDQDYHPDALSRFEAWLLERYGSREAGRRAWGLASSGAQALSPPRRPPSADRGALQRVMDWVAFKEELALTGVLRVAEMLRARLDVAARPLLFHNYPPGDALQSPYDIGGGEARGLDFQGVDLYPTRAQHRFLAKTARCLLGLSRFPVIPELGAGSTFWIGPVTLEDQRFTTPYLIMHGVAGVNFYMLVERERWYGSPIDTVGRVRSAQAAFFKPLLKALTELGVSSLETPTSVALVASRGYRRLVNACHLLSPIPPLLFGLMGFSAELGCSEEPFDFGRPLAIDFDLELDAWITALIDANIPFRIVDAESALEPSQRELVIAPTFGALDVETAETLGRWAGSGSELWIGPELPERSLGPVARPELFAELAALREQGLLEVGDRRAWSQRLAAWQPAWLEGLPAGLQAVAKRGRDGRGALFVANLGEDKASWSLPASIRQAQPRHCWGSGALEGSVLALPGSAVQVLALVSPLS
jgi:beta-galactosidase